MLSAVRNDHHLTGNQPNICTYARNTVTVNILEGLFGTIERISGNNQWMGTQPSFIAAVVAAATAVIFPSCYPVLPEVHFLCSCDDDIKRIIIMQNERGLENVS